MALSGWIHKGLAFPCLRFTVARGLAGRITASGGGRAWVVWDGVGSGVEMMISDPCAPIGVPTVYTLGKQTVTLTRRSVGSHLITGVDGRNQVRFRWTGADPITHEPGLSALSTSVGVSDRWPLVPLPERMRVEGLTSLADTTVLRSLVAARAPVIVLHDPLVCQVRDCDVDLVRRCVVTQAQEERTGRVDAAWRSWSLELEDRSHIPVAGAPGQAMFYVSGGPVVTWGEWASRWRWTHRSYAELAANLTGA